MARLSRCALLVLLVFAPAAPPVLASGAPAGPNQYEQYLIELVNRARADPAAEAARLGIDLNEGLPAGTIAPGARIPLGTPAAAQQAAALFAADILLNPAGYGSHVDSQGRGLNDRMEDAGIADYSQGRESNASMTATAQNATAIRTLYEWLFRSQTVSSRTHRVDMLRDTVYVTAAGCVFGKYNGKSTSLAVVDYLEYLSAYVPVYLLGVVYADQISDDDFFTPGEGLAGVSVQAVRVSDALTVNATTSEGGGYSVLIPDGTWNITVSGGLLPGPLTANGVVVAGSSVKRDFATTGVDLPIPREIRMVSGSGKAAKTGGYSLAVKSMWYDPALSTLSDADVAALEVTVDGVSLFTEGAGRKSTKVKRDAGGGIVSVTIADLAGNKLTVDLVKHLVKMTVKSAPGLDLGDGEVVIHILTSALLGRVNVPATLSGTKYVLQPATGDFED